MGIREKLAAYCLNADHEIGGPKAEGFRRILGIDLASLDHLADALSAGILTAPVTDVRDNGPFGALCEVRIPVAGLGDRRDRVVPVTTSWELRHAGDAPRLVTAYIDGYLGTMATTKHAISEHDVVVLREPVGAWPAGTTGAVVSTYDNTLLVEITGPGGKTLDTIQVPAAQLALKLR